MGTEDERDEGCEEADRAYVPPTAVPARTRRDTLELEARVRIAPTADPRRAPTQPRLDVTDDRRPTLRKLKPGEPTPPGPPVVLDEPVPRASALMPVVEEGASTASLGTEAPLPEGPPSSRGKWKTDRLPILQSPPPPAPESERPAPQPKPNDRSAWIVPVAALALVAIALLAWSRLRRAEEPPAQASATSIAPPTVTEPPVETAPAPPAEPPPPPVAPVPEKAPEPTAKASAKPRATVAPTARPTATAEAPPSSAPAATSSAPSSPASAAPSGKPEPPELVQ